MSQKVSPSALAKGRTAERVSPPVPGEDVLVRVRACIAASGDRDPRGLTEALDRALRFEYERGYQDGYYSQRVPSWWERVGRGALSRFARRRRRRMRRYFRKMGNRPAVVRRAIIHFIIIIVFTAAAVVASLHLTSASHDERFAPPPADPK